MTRHEEGDGGETITLTRDELKEEIRKEIKHDGRKKFLRHALLYLVFLFVMLALPFLLIAGVAAKSGLFQVPVLSSWLYEAPAPTRIVVPLAGATPESILASMSAKAAFYPARGVAELSLSEQELTTLIGTQLEQSSTDGALPFPITSAQVALLSNGSMELYAITERDGNQAPVILTVTPEIVNGGLELQAEEFMIGALSVPDFVSDMILESLTDSVMGGLEDGLSGVGALDGITVEEGNIRVSLMPRL
ncbi:MAG: hypothetical protein U9Q03_01260 [Patescibacteria group bacterium]|nr:hypothetical protein [Patescibacteria group bacterium]